MTTLPFIVQAGLTALIMSWLGGCVVSDMHSRQVPVTWTVIPLAAAGFWRLTFRDWQSVLLVCVLAVISDPPHKGWRVLAGSLALLAGVLAVGSFEHALLVMVVFAVWFLWETGATGGADAKIIIAVVLFFGDGLLLFSIVIAGGFQGVVGWVKKQKTIPFTVSILLGTAVYLLVRVYVQ